jgi:hypothetical protein
MGTWNSTYYEEYLTALDFLKDQKVQELPKQDADV